MLNDVEALNGAPCPRGKLTRVPVTTSPDNIFSSIYITVYPRISTFLLIISPDCLQSAHFTFRTKMAKSLRSKVKQAAGRKRRSDSHYAVAEAERIKRLSTKLMDKSKTAEKPAVEGGDEGAEAVKEEDTTMEGGQYHLPHDVNCSCS